MPRLVSKRAQYREYVDGKHGFNEAWYREHKSLATLYAHNEKENMKEDNVEDTERKRVITILEIENELRRQRRAVRTASKGE